MSGADGAPAPGAVDVKDTAWLDADFLKPLEERGKPIVVRESVAETAELQAIR